MEYASSCESGSVRAEVLATVKYLSALNSIFEQTLLGSSVCVFDSSGTTIQRLDEGFEYFEEWAAELIDSGVFDEGVSSEQFLSWQV